MTTLSTVRIDLPEFTTYWYKPEEVLCHYVELQEDRYVYKEHLYRSAYNENLRQFEEPVFCAVELICKKEAIRLIVVSKQQTGDYWSLKVYGCDSDPDLFVFFKTEKEANEFKERFCKWWLS